MDIYKTYNLPFDVTTVFEAWISNDHLVTPVTEIEIEPRTGGVIRLTTDAATMSGEILVYEKNRRLSYTWHWGGPDPSSIVDVTFAAENNETQVDVAHTGLPSEESVQTHEHGWDSYIVGLTARLKNS